MGSFFLVLSVMITIINFHIKEAPPMINKDWCYYFIFRSTLGLHQDMPERVGSSKDFAQEGALVIRECGSTLYVGLQQTTPPICGI